MEVLKKQDAGLDVQEEARRSESRGVVPHASVGSKKAGLGGHGLEKEPCLPAAVWGQPT